MLVRAELLKLRRQRGAFFWGFLALPCLLIVLACVLDGSLLPDASAAVEVRPVRTLLRALAAAGNPMVQLFFAIGAAALFSLEYRHSGWRLLVPRRRRATLLGAKLAAFLIAAAASLLLLCLGNLFAMFVLPLVRGAHPVVHEAVGAGTTAILLSAVVSMVQLAGLGALVALMAVLTRSTMGAILPPFLLSLCSSAIQAYLNTQPLALPGVAPDLLRAAIANPFDGAAVLSANQAIVAALVTLAWFVVPMAAALYLFSRQDLASE